MSSSGSYIAALNSQLGGLTKQQLENLQKNYKTGTTAGTMFDTGLDAMSNWAKMNPDNKDLGGQLSGAMMDSGRSLMNMGLGLQWQRGQLGNWAEYHGGMENLKTGNTMKLMGAEGGIVKELMGEQARLGDRQIKVTGDQDRKTLQKAGVEKRLSQQEEGSQTRMNYMGEGLQNRLQSQTEGREDRRTQAQKYREERKMRADARGAIRREGSKFFG
tara:strand:- start:8906 stop:9553 length:648 start_codon:yes stop_codon:yes gene_type:complete